MTLDSIANPFNLLFDLCQRFWTSNRHSLKGGFATFDFSVIPKDERKKHRPKELLLRYITGSSSECQLTPEAISWFHATRVPLNTTFEEGIQPLKIRLPRIWKFLEVLAVRFNIVSPDKWQHLKQTLPGDRTQYSLKRRSNCAMMVHSASYLRMSFSTQVCTQTMTIWVFQKLSRTSVWQSEVRSVVN